MKLAHRGTAAVLMLLWRTRCALCNSAESGGKHSLAHLLARVGGGRWQSNAQDSTAWLAVQYKSQQLRVLHLLLRDQRGQARVPNKLGVRRFPAHSLCQKLRREVAPSPLPQLFASPRASLAEGEFLQVTG